MTNGSKLRVLPTHYQLNELPAWKTWHVAT